MEHRMESQDQPSEGSRQSSLPETPSALLQEQKLFRRFMWLTLLLGLTLGILLTLAGELWYVLAGYIPYAFYPTSPVIYRLLTPLMMISMGCTSIVYGQWQQLRQQHPALRPGRFDPFGNPPGLQSSLSYGLFSIGIGGFEVLVLWRGSDTLWGNMIQLLWIIGVLIGILAVWIVPFLKRRRQVQQ